MEYYYCGCHGITFSTEEDGICPSCSDEWMLLDENNVHHPDYVEDTEGEDA